MRKWQAITARLCLPAVCTPLRLICDMIRRGQAAGTVRHGDPERLYYAVIGLGGTLFSVSTEFRLLTQRDVFAAAELRSTIDQILDFMFHS